MSAMGSEARAIVEVRLGPLQGKKAAISPGGKLVVGRTEFADMVVANDTQMMGEHFELLWDGELCKLKDLGKGTLVGGQAVEGEALVEHGEWIRAGGTDFSVYIEGLIPAREEEEDDDEVGDEDEERRGLRLEREAERARERKARADAAEKALGVLRAEAKAGELYAVLDAARDDRILELLRQNVEAHRSLYEGIEGETMAEVAPYLVGPMGEDSHLLKALVEEGWGKRWGIYCVSGVGFKGLRRHFRRFLMVEEESTGERMYFRFYDPWVMSVFLPVSTERQRVDIFSIITVFIIEKTVSELIKVLQ